MAVVNREIRVHLRLKSTVLAVLPFLEKQLFALGNVIKLAEISYETRTELLNNCAKKTLNIGHGSGFRLSHYRIKANTEEKKTFFAFTFAMLLPVGSRSLSFGTCHNKPCSV